MGDDVIQGGQGLEFRFRHPVAHGIGNPLRVECLQPTEGKGLLVELHGDAVDFHGALDGLRRYRQQAQLGGIADQEQVGRDTVAHQCQTQTRGVYCMQLARHRLQLIGNTIAVNHQIGIALERWGRSDATVDYHLGMPRVVGYGWLTGQCGHGIEGQRQVRLADTQLLRAQLRWLTGNAQVAVDRTVLLTQAGHVEDRAGLVFQVRRHAQQGADGDHTGSADAGNHDIEGAVQRRQRRRRQALDQLGDLIGFFRLARLGIQHGDKARAEALHAAVVLVAVGLVDLALAAQLGFLRPDADAIGLHRAIAASFTDVRVDEYPLGRVGELAALAPTALFRGAGLFVDDDGDTLGVAQLALHCGVVIPVMHGHALPQAAVAVVVVRVVGHHHTTVYAFGQHLAGDVAGGQRAVHRLAAGHRHRVVEQDAKGHVDLGRHRATHRQQAGVVIGAIAHVLEDVRHLGEVRQAVPVCTLAAHLGVGQHFRTAVHGHGVAADTAGRHAALDGLGAGVVRATGAEVR